MRLADALREIRPFWLEDVLRVDNVDTLADFRWSLAVGDDDYGRVIGRGGRTASALRTVVKAAAVREKRRVLVDIVD